jgi:hypothetical protein
MKRTIKNPHWINNARTMLSAEFHYEDGRIVAAVISDTDKGNPDLQEVMQAFSVEEIEANTQRAIKKINSKKEAEAQAEAAKTERKKQEDLFAVKLKAFEIDAVKESTNRALKSKIRRAKSDFEVIAFTAAVILDSVNQPAPTTEDTPTE